MSKKYRIKLDFVRDLLGPAPSSDEIRTEYILKKMLTGRTGVSADVAMWSKVGYEKIRSEIENLKKDPEYQKRIEEIGDKALTVFYRDAGGKPSISDVQIRGFMKAAFAFVGKEHKLLTKKASGEAYSSDEYYKKWIGERIMFPKQYIPVDGAIDILERPLQCQTMQGPRVSIASSERIKAPVSIEFNLVTTDEVEEKTLELIFERGMFKGISQWANAQYGTFTYKIHPLEQTKIV